MTGELEHILRYYETLQPSDVTHSIVRRSVVDPKQHTKDVSVTTLGRSVPASLYMIAHFKFGSFNIVDNRARKSCRTL